MPDWRVYFEAVTVPTERIKGKKPGRERHAMMRVFLLAASSLMWGALFGLVVYGVYDM